MKRRVFGATYPLFFWSFWSTPLLSAFAALFAAMIFSAASKQKEEENNFPLLQNVVLVLDIL